MQNFMVSWGDQTRTIPSDLARGLHLRNLSECLWRSFPSKVVAVSAHVSLIIGHVTLKKFKLQLKTFSLSTPPWLTPLHQSNSDNS